MTKSLFFHRLRCRTPATPYLSLALIAPGSVIVGFGPSTRDYLDNTMSAQAKGLTAWRRGRGSIRTGEREWIDTQSQDIPSLQGLQLGWCGGEF